MAGNTLEFGQHHQFYIESPEIDNGQDSVHKLHGYSNIKAAALASAFCDVLVLVSIVWNWNSY